MANTASHDHSVERTKADHRLEPENTFTSYGEEMTRRIKVWISKKVSDDYLIATLQSMESSRKMLIEDAQRMLTLIFVLFLAVAALISFAATEASGTRSLHLPLYGISVALLLTIPFLAKLSIQKVAAA